MYIWIVNQRSNMLRDLICREPNRLFERFKRIADVTKRLQDTDEAITAYLKDHRLNSVDILRMQERPKEYVRLVRRFNNLYNARLALYK
jgi:hypothetical protein